MKSDETKDNLTKEQDKIISRALTILSIRMANNEIVLNDSTAMTNYLMLKCGQLEQEVFGMLCFNSQLQLIADTPLFFGSINASAVHPREVIKTALKHNAAAVVLYHNHPSGETVPSPSDIETTKQLLMLLKMLDISLIDHIIVAGSGSRSLREGNYF
jgi:DNA repair protein RadC